MKVDFDYDKIEKVNSIDCNSLLFTSQHQNSILFNKMLSKIKVLE